MKFEQEKYPPRTMAARKDNSMDKVPASQKVAKDHTYTMSSEFALKSAASTASLSMTQDADRADLTTSTLNTLSMISTPWSTESWYSFTESLSELSEESDSTSFISWTSTLDSLSTLSVDPRSTTTTGVHSRTVGTLSKTTLTIYSFAPTPCHSNQIQIATTKKSDKSVFDTVSSWTMETFTSVGLLSSRSIVKAKYPWSPTSTFTFTDYYPSSLESLASRKGSRVSVVSGSASAKVINYPMNYMKCNTKAEDHPRLDWALAKQNGIPVMCTAK